MPAPNPGSPEAVKKGCRCPVVDNEGGRGFWPAGRGEGKSSIFTVSCDCPVHTVKKP